MDFNLPDNLFSSHRLIEESELNFRLSENYRNQLLKGSDAPLPTNLPEKNILPLNATPALARHLEGIFGHFIRLDDTRSLLEALIKYIVDLTHQSPDACIAAILLNSYHSYTPLHAINCALLCTRAANNLDLSQDEANSLIGAALTMNLSSCEVQDQLARQDTPPSTMQRQILNLHPLLSSALLREVNIINPLWHSNVLMHHERHDGRGYSFGAKGEDIPPQAQLLHLLDVVTAKLMPRSYRKSVPPQVALASLYAGTKETFDSQHITQLVKILGIYPPGSFVDLENGDHALVIKNGKTATTPIVISNQSPDHSIDTNQPGYHVKQSISMAINARHIQLLNQHWN